MESTLPESALPPHPPPPDRDKTPIVSAVPSSSPAAFQEVIYIERTSALGDVVYIPKSTVFEQRCSCGEISSDSPMLVPLTGANRFPEVSSSVSLACLASAELVRHTSDTGGGRKTGMARPDVLRTLLLLGVPILIPIPKQPPLCGAAILIPFPKFED